MRGRLVKSLAFAVAYSIVSLVVLCLSVFYIVAPRVFMRFVAWYSGMDTRSPIKPNPPKERFVLERIAGFFMFLVALMMVRLAVSWLIQGGVVMYTPPKTPENPRGPFGWVILGIAIIVIGVFFLIRPETLLRVTRRNFPDMVFPPRFVGNAPLGGRIFGVLAILSGLYLLYLAHT
jgi:hypothetical protein